MRYLIIAAIIFLVVSVSSWPMAGADTNRLIEQMKSGGHVLMIRHAQAPGSGDPENFTIGDCSTQRNLDDRGRAQARAIGDWLRLRGIKKARMYSSQWCRCLDTANLINMGPVTPLPALNSFYDLPQDREPNLKELRLFLSKQKSHDELLILVTHFVTISAISGEAVSSGEGVVLRMEEKGTHEFVGKLDFDYR
jgi:broad specificity phosphatase PhoE